jgi:hypothetical protein
MSTTISIEKLPYNIQSSKIAQLTFLANIIGIRKELLINAGQKEIDAMCATILYRHLPQAQRNYAMQLIRSVNNKPLQGKLIENVLLTTFVNPQWGIWSLSNKELESDQQFHQLLDNLASYIGISASFMGVKDIYEAFRKNKKMGRASLVLLVIFGAVAFNKSELNKVNKELKNRSVILTSELYK